MTDHATDNWLAIEAPVSLDQQRAVLPGITVFRDNGLGAIGVRARAGVLSATDQMPTTAERELVGGLGFALRRRLGPVWFELGGGVAATQHGFAPLVEAATGATFVVGAVEVSPAFRYVRVEQDALQPAMRDALMFGAELALSRERSRRSRVVAVPTNSPEAPEAAPVTCAEDPLPCERELASAIDAGLIAIADDRIVIDVLALLSPTTMQLHDAGHAIVAAILERWKRQPDWKRLRIEGYAELASSDLDNWKSSQRWTASVRNQMIERGTEGHRVTAIGYGRLQTTKPVDGSRPTNRLEIVIERAEVE